MPDRLGKFVGLQRGERDDLELGEFVVVSQVEKQLCGPRAGLGGLDAPAGPTGPEGPDGPDGTVGVKKYVLCLAGTSR